MEMYGPSMQKRFNPGPAARNGVTAARMAQLGFTGADTIFEGERGFLKAFSDKTRCPSSWSTGLDEALPARHRVQALLVRAPDPQRDRLRAGDPPQAVGFDAERRAARSRSARHPGLGALPPEQAPATYHEAQVSLPFSVAVALIEGQALFEQYNDRNLRSRCCSACRTW